MSNVDNGKARTAQRGWSQELSTTMDWRATHQPDQEAFSLLSMVEGLHHICPLGFRNWFAGQIVLALVHGSTNEELYLDLIVRAWSQNPGMKIWCCYGIHPLCCFPWGWGWGYFIMKRNEYLGPREQNVVNFIVAHYSLIISHRGTHIPVLCHVSCSVPPYDRASSLIIGLANET